MTIGYATVVITADGFSNIVFFSFFFIYIFYFYSVGVTVAVSVAVTLTTVTIVLLLLVCGVRHGVIPILAVLPAYSAAPHQRRPPQATDVEACGGGDGPPIQTARISSNTFIKARTRSAELGRDDIEMSHCSDMPDEAADTPRTKQPDLVVDDTVIKVEVHVGDDLECSTSHDGLERGASMMTGDCTEVREKKIAQCEKCNGTLRGGKSVNRPCICDT